MKPPDAESAGQPSGAATPFDRFRDLTRRLLSVPKTELPKHEPKRRQKLTPRTNGGKKK
jgi:hypothetical protein